MGEIDIYGVFVPGLLVWMVTAFVISVPLRRVLSRSGIYHVIWHRPLFDLALYVVLLGVVVTLAKGLLS
jgi:hypothetical protein